MYKNHILRYWFQVNSQLKLQDNYKCMWFLDFFSQRKFSRFIQEINKLSRRNIYYDKFYSGKEMQEKLSSYYNLSQDVHLDDFLRVLGKLTG